MDLEQQLSNQGNPPPSKAVREFLAAHGIESVEDGLWERLVWELKRNVPPDEALQRARFALAIQEAPAPSVEKGIARIRRLIGRDVITLKPGQHISPYPEIDVVVVNLSSNRVYVAAGELRFAHKEIVAGRPLTVVVDDQQQAEARVDEDQGRVIWTVPAQSQEDNPWLTLTDCLGIDMEEAEEVAVEVLGDLRYPVSIRDDLPHEHRIRAERARALLSKLLTYYAYGPDLERLVQVGEEEAEEVITALDHVFNRYTERPRMVITCRNLVDFSPAEEWRVGTRRLRELINMVTGDDQHLASALASAEALQLGALSFTGDPDCAGDDLLSTTLPVATCSVILSPHVLERCLFLTGLPHPTADLPVPQRQHGFYSTIATIHELHDMLRTRFYFELSPAIREHSRRYFQGRSIEVGFADDSQNPAFHALGTAVYSYIRQDGSKHGAKRFQETLRVAAGRALYQCLAEDIEKDCVAVVHLGKLQLSDVEKVVVTLNQQEFEQYQRGGLPPHLLQARQSLQLHGIQLSLRPPVSRSSV